MIWIYSLVFSKCCRIGKKKFTAEKTAMDVDKFSEHDIFSSKHRPQSFQRKFARPVRPSQLSHHINQPEYVFFLGVGGRNQICQRARVHSNREGSKQIMGTLFLWQLCPPASKQKCHARFVIAITLWAAVAPFQQLNDSEECSLNPASVVIQ